MKMRLMAVFCAAAVCSTLVSCGKKGNTELVMPDLYNVDYMKAVDEFDFLRINIESKTYSTDVKKGRIIQQDIEAGTDVTDGQKVLVVVSLGAEGSTGDGKTYTVPDLTGMDYDDAVAHYGDTFNIEIDSTAFSGGEINMILSQSPAPGSEISSGDTLKVKVSRDAKEVEMPDLKGMTKELAMEQLKQKGLEAEVKVSSNNSIKKGCVISTEPKAGTSLTEGDTVTLMVSMGRGDGVVVVEDYTGLPLEDAMIMAQYAGLKTRSQTRDSTQKEGTVVDQSIKPGEEADEGSQIILYVSTGETPDGEAEFSFQMPSDASGSFAIEFVTINDDKTTSSSVSQSFTLPGETVIKHKIKGMGEKAKVTAVLTNLSNGTRGQIGTYTVNFASGEITAESENIRSAFDAVGGLYVYVPEETEYEEPEYEEPEYDPGYYDPGYYDDPGWYDEEVYY